MQLLLTAQALRWLAGQQPVVVDDRGTVFSGAPDELATLLDRPATTVLGAVPPGFEQCTPAVAYRRCQRSRPALDPGGQPAEPCAGHRAAEDDLPGRASRLGAALYAIEGWSFTPEDEQRQPATWCGRFSRLCAQVGVQSVCAPALTLPLQQSRGGAGRATWKEHLGSGLAEAIGEVADTYVIQCQRYQVAGALDEYADFVESAARAARAARAASALWPRPLAVLAGLSTGPGGRAVGLAELAEAVDRTEGLVDGYWLNVPRRGPACPTCAPFPRPDIGAGLLGHLAKAGRL